MPHVDQTTYPASPHILVIQTPNDASFSRENLG